MGSPGGTSGKEPACQFRRQETRVQSLGWDDLLEEDTANQIFMPEESHGQSRLRGAGGYRPRGHK